MKNKGMGYAHATTKGGQSCLPFAYFQVIKPW